MDIEGIKDDLQLFGLIAGSAGWAFLTDYFASRLQQLNPLAPWLLDYLGAGLLALLVIFLLAGVAYLADFCALGIARWYVARARQR